MIKLFYTMAVYDVPPRRNVVNRSDSRRFNVDYRDSLRRFNGANYLFFDSAHCDT